MNTTQVLQQQSSPSPELLTQTELHNMQYNLELRTTARIK